MKLTVGVSNRHVHLTKEHLEYLFGKDYVLNNIKDLKQPGQFSTDAIVALSTEKATMDRVRVLGPIRNYTQVEISMTDAYKLGLKPPVRESGNLKGSESITIIGPKGELKITEGVIIADRHIHIMETQMEQYGLKGKEKVSVLIPGEKGGIINNVSLKVSKEAYLELHLDTDDANAHLLHDGDIVEII